MRKTLIFLMLLAGMTSLVLAQDSGDSSAPSEFVGQEQFPAPEFPTGLDWINVPRALTLADLRGKIVILDFWTYGCINCIHMIPVLEQIEAKYADEVAIVGVHSAKFANEGETENIRQIVQRYELKHPVINDHQFKVWGTFAPYGVQAWPTFVIIDPRGNLLAVQPGEIPFEAFDRVLTGMVAYFDGTGELDRDPIDLTLESAARANTALAFPGKILADPTGSRLFISDSSHNRIVIADLVTYEVLDVIGTGSRGFDNGGFDAATFDKPQGMALSKDGMLYVADVNNHAIRAANLTERTVTTLAGTGVQARTYNQAGPANRTALSSPLGCRTGRGRHAVHRNGWTAPTVGHVPD
ncbi:MAG: redoxin domain-containing protein, partial [Anaerolineae bacterium]|nr:redoxin domain-containing protein [Anaerolineae bacterium]